MEIVSLWRESLTQACNFMGLGVTWEGDGEKPGLEKYWAEGQNGKKCLQGVFCFFFFKSWLHMESSAEARPQIKRPKSEGGAGSTNIQRT